MADRGIATTPAPPVDCALTIDVGQNQHVDGSTGLNGEQIAAGYGIQIDDGASVFVLAQE
ncbi:hypothetical protein ACFSOZ_02065 [Mesorhizobium newzealandense]|uniref:Uncharacterized protein n=1 Tax=Mesorhizobium newzealandense TaxID=1300302 RepID=A0ABW4U4K6_9HYPH